MKCGIETENRRTNLSEEGRIGLQGRHEKDLMEGSDAERGGAA